MKKKLILIPLVLGCMSLNAQGVNAQWYVSGEYGETGLVESMSINDLKLEFPSENRHYDGKVGAILNNRHRVSVACRTYETNVDVGLTELGVGYEYLFEVPFGFSILGGIGLDLSAYTVDFGYYGDLDLYGLNTTVNLGVGYNVNGTFGWEFGYRKGLFGMVEGDKEVNKKNVLVSLDKRGQLYFSLNWNTGLSSRFGF